MKRGNRKALRLLPYSRNDTHLKRRKKEEGRRKLAGISMGMSDPNPIRSPLSGGELNPSARS
ncbi:MAG: hypothetical protein AAFW70_07580 [Cyanobacteria bacterium J06635_10]